MRSESSQNVPPWASNVARAFAARNSKTIEGKRILLIDDVLTTGATASACAQTLLKAGAVSVSVLVIARVPLTHA